MSKEISKFLSYVLRHKPESIGLRVDAGGWAQIHELIPAAKKAGHKVTREVLEAVVAENDKKRFTISQDGRRIRAAQGHSIEVDLGLDAIAPPDVLFHGTSVRNLDSIFANGLLPGSRRQVHLSLEQETAMTVGQRHGKATVLVVDAARMHAGGHKFYRADNGVWLTDHVPADYLTFEPAEVPRPAGC